MRLLKLDAVSQTWNRCKCCGHLTRPAILARTVGETRSEWHCFRCYHILAAVVVVDHEQKGAA